MLFALRYQIFVGGTMSKLIILDAGHGENTPGKRSPVWADGSQLFEYEFNRDIVRRVSVELGRHGINSHILVPEYTDVSLAERVRRANEVYRKNGAGTFLVSVHANAGGGTGWECFTTPGVTKSDAIATAFCEQAEKAFGKDWKIRKDTSDGDPDKESAFYILQHTACPAVLTENFFMDTERDCRFIMSEAGRKQVADVHVDAIKRAMKL
jgi:N-acetylmuramoyl-L-alanine amidase